MYALCECNVRSPIGCIVLISKCGMVITTCNILYCIMCAFRVHSRSEGFPARSYLVPAHGTPGALPDGQSCWDGVAVAAAVSWFPRGAIAPRTPPCLSSKEEILAQMVKEHKHSKLMVQMGRKSTGSTPSVFPDSQVIPECSVLQYLQIHRSNQNGPSVFPHSRVLRMLGPLMPKV